MPTLWTLWWVWLALALILGSLEILAPGYVFLGFAVGALAMALMLGKLGLSLTLPVSILIFAFFSLSAWLVLRRIFASPKGQVKIIKDDIND
ncbi:MAG: hypothetical protein GDA36_04465 [Rhodobacteraceae bacterium]|nr:hypothetical protein [Paracoccaceae bacterium]